MDKCIEPSKCLHPRYKQIYFDNAKGQPIVRCVLCGKYWFQYSLHAMFEGKWESNNVQS